jgi:cytosine deaminase
MDLIIRRAGLSSRPEALVDIGIESGRIAAIMPALAADGPEYDAAEGLVCAGLIETHIHLDKSRIIERCPPEETRDVNPVTSVALLKKTFTVEDVHMRAARTLEECILHGATRMRTQVEVDPGIGLRGFEAVAALVAEYKWAIDIEICVFPQEGLTNCPGTDELLIEALKRGAQAIGGAPRYDTDGPAQVSRIFELAREFDVDIDIHLDVGPNADHLYIHQVCELTEKCRRGGHVVVGHMAKLSTMPPDKLEVVARRMADVGIAVTVLPATDLYLMGRDQDHNVRRGVVDANVLVAHGVNCSLSTNNVLNPATPYGDCSLIRIANLHANVLQVRHPKELRECFAMLTERSARLLNLNDYGLEIGNPADVVVFDAQTPEQVIAEIRNPLCAFKRGRQTMLRRPAQLIRPQPT